MKRELVYQAIQRASEDSTNFLALVQQHHTKADSFDVVEYFQTLPKKQHPVVWAALLALTENAVERLDDTGDKMEEGVCSVLSGVILFCEGAMAQESPALPAPFTQTLQLLHDILLNLSEIAPDLPNAISLLCEGCWSRDLGDCDGLVPHCLLYLVARTLADGATLGDVRRVWSMRQAFLLLDFEDASADSLKCMLLSCLIQPLYLKSEEGRKFLSFLFGMHPKFVEDLHQTIKNQIPHCPKSFLEVYGEIYFRAWRLASGPYLKQIEEHCLQDLMFCAVHAPRQGLHSLYHALRRLLGYVHQQRNQKGVSEMLLRLYNPFLWRSLKVANPYVRANAASLLLDAFPLQDPDSTREEIDLIMQKQFDIMMELLGDPCVLVRVAGVAGVCRVLSLFWEMVPASVIKALLGKLVKELAWDAAAINVRVAVLQGVCVVMENRLSHPILRELLPLLHCHLHDTSEKVRIAFLDLLLLVKGMRSIKFWQVCPLEHLLARMEVDSVHVVKRIVALLVDSFQPSNISPSQQIERCVVLLRANPGAARRFYQLAVTHLSPSEVARFIFAIHATIVQCVQREEERGGGGGVSGGIDDEPVPMEEASVTPDPSQDPTGIVRGGWREEGVGGRSELSESMEAESDGDTDILTLRDSDLMTGFLETMVILWEGARERLDRPGNRTLKTRLTEKISESLPLLMDTFKDGSSRSALYLLASFLPKKAVSGIIPGTLQTLASLSYPTNSLDYTTILVALVAWQQTSHVIKLTNQWLASEFNGKDKEAPPPTKNRHGKMKNKRGMRNNVAPPPPPQPMLALEILNWMMSHPVCFEGLKKQRDFWELSDLLKKSMDLLEQFFSPESDRPSSSSSFELLSEALSVYIRVNMHHRSEFDCPAEFAVTLQELLAWGDRVLLPMLNTTASTGTRQSSRKRKVGQPHPPVTSDPTHQQARVLTEMILELLTEVLISGLADSALEGELAQFTASIAETASAPSLLPSLSKLLFQLCEVSGKCEVEGIHTDSSLRPTALLLDKILTSLQRMAETDQDAFSKAWSMVRQCVTNAIVTSVRTQSLAISHHSLSIYSVLVERAVVAQATHLKQRPTLEAATAVEDLPLFVSSVVRQSCKNTQCIGLFAGHLSSYLDECESVFPDVFLTHQAALHIVTALAHGKQGGEELAPCVRRSLRLVELLTEEQRRRWNGPVTEVCELLEALQERLFH